jgi:Flp pilus assembly protein TadD
VSYHTELCRLFLRQGRVADAITALRRAIEINDKNGHIWAHMGNLLASQGALDEAEEALRHAIKLHPAVAGFHAGLARVLNRLERQDDALNAAKAAVELAPNDQAHRRFYDDLVTRFGARPLLTTANAGTVAPPRTNNVPPRSSDRVYADAINEVSDYSHIQHAAC